MLSLFALRGEPSAPRAAQDFGDLAMEAGSFDLVERSGRKVTDGDLADRVWIGSFIFTRCPLSCPRISSVMKGLQAKLAGSHVLLVSISVDPDHDTPPVLADYAARFGAEGDRWWFLTGNRDAIYSLIRDRFRLSVMENPAPDPEAKGESILHSDRLALVDRGRIVGLFDSTDPSAIDDLIAQARRRASPPWVRLLPPINASLNTLCAVLLLVGWISIRRRHRARQVDEGLLAVVVVPPAPRLRSSAVRGHVTCMALAVATSAAFLTCYLLYHYHAGSVAFRGQGAIRPLYFTILISHTLLATFGVVPLVSWTLFRALRQDFSRHAQVAAVTFPIWLYVSLTGILIYLLLYHLPTVSSDVPQVAMTINSDVQ